jgi:glycosyltransferase involved in cell wall biosynthesis
MRPPIHQLVHTLSYGDAISGAVIALQRVFRESGHESEIYAINTHPRYKGLTKDYRTLSTEYAGEIVLHLSIGSPLSQLYLSLTAARRTVIYHNITPSRWFSGVNPRVVRDIEQGMNELREVMDVSDRVLADSQFNASELEKFTTSVQVLPLTVDPARWTEGANAGITSLLKSDPSIHLLHIGRMAPNKCIEDILKIFYFVHHHVEPRSVLWLVGIDIDTEIYSFSLKKMARELEIDDAVRFVGGMSDSEVRAFYEHSSAYLCMSEHEGFCLPVIEAMHFGLPVVAFDSSAVTETIAGGGILVHEKRHAEIAELVVDLSRSGSLRERVVAAGFERVADFSFDRFAENARAIFNQDMAVDPKQVSQEAR